MNHSHTFDVILDKGWLDSASISIRSAPLGPKIIWLEFFWIYFPTPTRYTCIHYILEKTNYKNYKQMLQYIIEKTNLSASISMNAR